MKLFYFLPVPKITGIVRKSIKPASGVSRLLRTKDKNFAAPYQLLYTEDKPFIDTELGDY